MLLFTAPAACLMPQFVLVLVVVVVLVIVAAVLLSLCLCLCLSDSCTRNTNLQNKQRATLCTVG